MFSANSKTRRSLSSTSSCCAEAVTEVPPAKERCQVRDEHESDGQGCSTPSVARLRSQEPPSFEWSYLRNNRNSILRESSIGLSSGSLPSSGQSGQDSFEDSVSERPRSKKHQLKRCQCCFEKTLSKSSKKSSSTSDSLTGSQGKNENMLCCNGDTREKHNLCHSCVKRYVRQWLYEGVTYPIEYYYSSEQDGSSEKTPSGLKIPCFASLADYKGEPCKSYIAITSWNSFLKVKEQAEVHAKLGGKVQIQEEEPKKKHQEQQSLADLHRHRLSLPLIGSSSNSRHQKFNDIFQAIQEETGSNHTRASWCGPSSSEQCANPRSPVIQSPRENHRRSISCVPSESGSFSRPSRVNSRRSTGSLTISRSVTVATKACSRRSAGNAYMNASAIAAMNTPRDLLSGFAPYPEIGSPPQSQVVCKEFLSPNGTTMSQPSEQKPMRHYAAASATKNTPLELLSGLAPGPQTESPPLSPVLCKEVLSPKGTTMYRPLEQQPIRHQNQLAKAKELDGPEKARLERVHSLQRVQKSLEELKMGITHRSCPTCNNLFVKENGCNKVSCNSCHTTMCYCCRQIVPVDGYDHWSDRLDKYTPKSQTGLCPLWTDEEVDRRADREAIKTKIYQMALQTRNYPAART